MATVSAFWPALHGGFIWDDDVHLTANPSIIGPQGLKEIWTTSAAVYYPLTLTTFWIQHLLWGLNPFPFHLMNIGVHAAVAVVLWRVLLRLNVRGAWFAAALWALHPVQAESVAWITELKNTQSGLFYVITIWFFLRWISAGTSAERKVQWAYVASVLFALLAILSKTSTVMLPVILALCWWWKEGKWRLRNTLWLLPFLLVSTAAGIWTIWEQAHHSGAMGAEWSQTWPERIVIAGRIVWFYLGKLIWPHPLSFIYPRWMVDSAKPLAYVPTLVVLVTLFVLWRKRNGFARPLFFAFAYFVTSLLPVSDLFDVYFFRYSFVADHFQYLAAIGPLSLAMASIAVVADTAKTADRIQPIVCGGILLLCGVLSWQQSTIYVDSLTLWRDTVRKNPNAWMARTNLGAELDDQGRYAEATLEYRAALRINPNDAGAHNNLATHLAEDGQTHQAIQEWNEALRIQPNNAAAQANRAYALLQVGRKTEAFEGWERALKINPDLSSAHYDYGVALMQTGQIDPAIQHLDRALQLGRNDAAVHYRMGLALNRQGNYPLAIVHYRKALELGGPPSLAARFALAWLLATSPEPRWRNGAEAVQLAQGGIDAGSGSLALDTLAAAYAEAGRFDRAIETASEALNRVATQNQSQLDGIRNRLKTYEGHRAYHEKPGATRNDFVPGER